MRADKTTESACGFPPFAVLCTIPRTPSALRIFEVQRADLHISLLIESWRSGLRPLHPLQTYLHESCCLLVGFVNGRV